MTGFCSPPFTISKGWMRRRRRCESQETEILPVPKAAIFFGESASN